MRLTISKDLQISLRDGKPDATGTIKGEAAKTEVRRWIKFAEEWLDATDTLEAKPMAARPLRKLSGEEARLLKIFQRGVPALMDNETSRADAVRLLVTKKKYAPILDVIEENERPVADD